MPRDKVLCGKKEIITVAARIVDTEGIAALSIRKIANELGVSPMTLYNYVDNLQEIKKHVLTGGFDHLYDSIYQALNKFEPPVDQFTFCKTLAKQIFSFAAENPNTFSFMQTEGRQQFSDDAEIRPFYSFISKLTKRAKATQETYVQNENCYKLLDIVTFSLALQRSSGISSITEDEYDELIEFFLKKCLIIEKNY